MHKWISSIFIRATGRNSMKRQRQGTGRCLLRKRSWLIRIIDRVSGMQGTGESLLTNPNCNRGQKNKKASQKRFNRYMDRFMRK